MAHLKNIFLEKIKICFLFSTTIIIVYLKQEDGIVKEKKAVQVEGHYYIVRKFHAFTSCSITGF